MSTEGKNNHVRLIQELRMHIETPRTDSHPRFLEEPLKDVGIAYFDDLRNTHKGYIHIQQSATFPMSLFRKRRYVIICQGCLYIFQGSDPTRPSSEERKVKESFSFFEFKGITSDASGKLTLTFKNDKKAPIIFSCSTPEESKQWKEIIGKLISEVNKYFYASSEEENECSEAVLGKSSVAKLFSRSHYEDIDHTKLKNTPEEEIVYHRIDEGKLRETETKTHAHENDEFYVCEENENDDISSVLPSDKRCTEAFETELTQRLNTEKYKGKKENEYEVIDEKYLDRSDKDTQMPNKDKRTNVNIQTKENTKDDKTLTTHIEKQECTIETDESSGGNERKDTEKLTIGKLIETNSKKHGAENDVFHVCEGNEKDKISSVLPSDKRCTEPFDAELTQQLNTEKYKGKQKNEYEVIDEKYLDKSDKDTQMQNKDKRTNVNIQTKGKLIETESKTHECENYEFFVCEENEKDDISSGAKQIENVEDKKTIYCEITGIPKNVSSIEETVAPDNNNTERIKTMTKVKSVLPSDKRCTEAYEAEFRQQWIIEKYKGKKERDYDIIDEKYLDRSDKDTKTPNKDKRIYLQAKGKLTETESKTHAYENDEFFVCEENEKDDISSGAKQIENVEDKKTTYCEITGIPKNVSYTKETVAPDNDNTEWIKTMTTARSVLPSDKRCTEAYEAELRQQWIIEKYKGNKERDYDVIDEKYLDRSDKDTKTPSIDKRIYLQTKDVSDSSLFTAKYSKLVIMTKEETASRIVYRQLWKQIRTNFIGPYTGKLIETESKTHAYEHDELFVCEENEKGEISSGAKPIENVEEKKTTYCEITGIPKNVSSIEATVAPDNDNTEWIKTMTKAKSVLPSDKRCTEAYEAELRQQWTIEKYKRKKQRDYDIIDEKYLYRSDKDTKTPNKDKNIYLQTKENTKEDKTLTTHIEKRERAIQTDKSGDICTSGTFSYWRENERKDTDKWTIDIGAWKKCLLEEGLNEQNIKTLLSEKVLPDESILRGIIFAQSQFSNIVHALLLTICDYIKQLSDKIRHVWPAYRVENDKQDITRVVFVVHTSMEIEIECHFTIYQRCEDKILDENLSENEKIYYYEQSNENKFTDEMARVRAFAKTYSKMLMQKHSNLTKVSISWVKSSGFGKKTARMENIPCIALYVQIKGLVPYREEPFDKTITSTEFPIDVREGVFTLCGKPDDLHQNVKMGCEIDSGYGTSQGTIGPFVQLHDSRETFFLTSAHVALNSRQMETLTKSKNEYIYYGISGNNTFQPPESKTVKNVNSRHHLGKIEMVVYKEGTENEAGVELALVQINKDREPVDGFFPDDISSSQTGACSSKYFQFSSGKILEREKLAPMTNVYKFGCSSGLTEGRYIDDCTSVRTNKLEDRGLGVDITLYNQIQIESRQFSEPFAEQGDSGSLVFAMDEGDSCAIGIFEGKMEPFYMVTPIKDSINVIGKHLSFHKTAYSSFNTGHRRNSEDVMEFESYGNLKVIKLPFETQAGPENPRNPIVELRKKTSNIETNIIQHTEHTFGTVKEELTAMKIHIDQSNVDMKKYLDEQFKTIKSMLAIRNDHG